MAPKAKLIFSPQKRQRKTVVPSAEKLEVFVIRYSERAQLVSESFDESQACFQIDVTNGGKPSMLYKLKDRMMEFLQSGSGSLSIRKVQSSVERRNFRTGPCVV